MTYTEQSGVIINLLPYDLYESKHWRGELTEGQAWIPTDLVDVIPTRNIDLRQHLGEFNVNTSGYATMKSGEIVYIKERTYEASITI